MARDHACEARAGLDRELVQRQVRGAERQRLRERRRPAVLGIAGERVDEVEADAPNMLLGGGERRKAFASGMGAAEEGEGLVVEALKAERDAVDPGAGEIGEAGGLHRARVRL